MVTGIVVAPAGRPPTGEQTSVDASVPDEADFTQLGEQLASFSCVLVELGLEIFS